MLIKIIFLCFRLYYLYCFFVLKKAVKLIWLHMTMKTTDSIFDIMQIYTIHFR